MDFLDRTISIMDTMQHADPREYFVAGESALVGIQECLRAAGVQRPPANILDLPSGHGRVLRWLRAAYPQSRIVACDTNHDGVDFCKKQFGVDGVYSEIEPKLIPIVEEFDLIWVGSLLTHFALPAWSSWLTWFRERLTAQGVLAFSTNGFAAAGLIKNMNEAWIRSLPGAGVQLYKDYASAGFGYLEYQDQVNYGLSLVKPSIGLSLLESHALTPVFFRVNAFHNVQDIFGAVRVE
jgi:hypothetical protein